MAAGTWNFTIEQGSTFVQPLIWTDNSNNPVSMAGCSAHMQLRNGPTLVEGAGDILYLDMTSSGGQITLGVSDGSITLTLTATQTAALAFTTAQYDLHIISPSGAVVRLLQGVVTLSPEITVDGGGGAVIPAGSGVVSSRTVSSTYTVLVTDYVIFADPTAAGFTISLPTAVGFSDVFVISVLGTSKNIVTVDPFGSELIQNQTTVQLGSSATSAAYTAITIISDGTKWWII